MNSDDDYGDYRKVMELTGLQKSAAYDLKDTITHRKLGKRVLFHLPSVREYVDNNTIVAKPIVEPVPHPPPSRQRKTSWNPPIHREFLV
jgi:hypothetical protein